MKHTGIKKILSYQGTARKSIWLAWALLFAGLIATAVATMYIKKDIEADAKREFDFACGEIELRIDARLDAHAQILRSAAALFDASDEVTRKEWHAFTTQQKIEQQLPGIQGIGFSLAIPREGLAQHIQEIRSQGFPDYTVRPAGDREIYTSIIYLEPFSGRNLRAFGYDMFSEPVRREAMEQARDFDLAALSGKVILVQETDQDVQAGTLMYVPVYRKGMPADTVAHRRAALYGWVYSPYRMNDLMQGISKGWDSEKGKRIRLEIFDNQQLSSDSLLYDSQPKAEMKTVNSSPLTIQIPVAFNDHYWYLRFTQTSGEFNYVSAYSVLFGGVIISLLIFWLLISLLNTFRAQQLTDRLTVDLREREEKLRETNEYLDNLFTYANAPIVVWDPQFRITRFNHAFEFLTGRIAGEVIGQTVDLLFPPSQRQLIMELLLKTLKGERLKTVEIEILQREGTIRTLLWNSATLFDSDGKTPIATIAQGQDITDRKQAEEEKKMIEAQLSRSEKMASIGQLAAGVAHEINNPTGFIQSNLNTMNKYMQGMTEMLSAYSEGMAALPKGNMAVEKLFSELEEKKKRFKISHILEDVNNIIRESLEGIGRITSIVNDLKSFSHVDQNEIKPADINTELDITINVLWNELKYKCTIDKQYGSLPPLNCNAGQMKQVFANLLINASQAIEKKGAITIQTRHVIGADTGGAIEIIISDTGSGIAPDKINRIFEPFFTTKEVGKGTGLGLSISYDIIKKHGGDISVESAVGKGTTFTILLPEISNAEKKSMRGKI